MYQRPLTSDEIYHHGILGQKWGVRRYQNPDGTLTDAGRQRVSKIEQKYDKSLTRKTKDINDAFIRRDERRKKIEKQIEKREEKVKKASTDRNRTFYQRKVDAKKDKLETLNYTTKKYEAGKKIYEDNINNFKNMKMKAVSDPSIKKTSEYKEASRIYARQRKRDVINSGRHILTVGEYATSLALEDYLVNEYLPSIGY